MSPRSATIPRHNVVIEVNDHQLDLVDASYRPVHAKQLRPDGASELIDPDLEVLAQWTRRLNSVAVTREVPVAKE